MSPVTDPIGDLLTRVRNAQHARKSSCRAPWSRIKQELCTLLKREGWIADVQVTGESPFQELEVTFAREKGPLSLKRISTPGRKSYVSYRDIRPVLQGMGIAILTTSAGLLTDREARKRRMGGEVLCTIS